MNLLLNNLGNSLAKISSKELKQVYLLYDLPNSNVLTRNEIISNLFNGKNFRDCIGKMEPDHLREDLRQEVILIICELSTEKIHQLHNDKALEFFTVRVILNQIKSKTSPFAKKYRQVTNEYNEDAIGSTAKRAIVAAELLASDSIETEERELREMIEDMALEEVDKLYWYDKGLIELYLRHGNFRAIEKETGIPFGSCYKNIKRSFSHIKKKVS